MEKERQKMKFIEVTARDLVKRIAIPVERIVRVIEEDKGCFLAVNERKRHLIGISVFESYDEVLEMLNSTLEIGEKKPLL